MEGIHRSSAHSMDRHRAGIVSSAADVVGMGVVRGMRGACGVYEMCMCLARCGFGSEGG